MRLILFLSAVVATLGLIAHNNYMQIHEMFNKAPNGYLELLFTIPVLILSYFLFRVSQKQTDIMQDTMHSQRAFVFADGVKADNVTSADLKLRIYWKNTGDTPPKNLILHANFGLFSSGMPDDFNFPDYGHQRRIPTLLGPHSELTSTPLLIPLPHIDEVIRGNTHLFTWGWAEYNDIFEGTSRHRTEFCYQVNFEKDPIEETKLHVIYSSHYRHNGTDEECKPCIT